MVSNEGVGDAVRDGLRGANHSNSLAIARIWNDADRPRPRPHTHEEIVNTFLVLGSATSAILGDLFGGRGWRCLGRSRRGHPGDGAR